MTPLELLKVAVCTIRNKIIFIAFLLKPYFLTCPNSKGSKF
jgi:hypothetical protein